MPSCPRCSYRLVKSGADWWCLYHGEQYLPLISVEEARDEVERKKPRKEESLTLIEAAKRLGTRVEIVRRIAVQLGLEHDRQTIYSYAQFKLISKEYFRHSGGTSSPGNWASRNRVPLRVVQMTMKELGLRGRLSVKQQELLYETLVDPGHMRVWTVSEVAEAYGITIIWLNSIARQRLGLQLKGKAGVLTRDQIMQLFDSWKL